MSNYSTKQREILLSFFSSHEDCSFTAKELAAKLCNEGISLSAIYRNLSSMEENGLLKSSSRPGSHELYYRYIDSEQCAEKLHLSCKKCGKIFHASADAAQKIISLLNVDDDFSLNKEDTTIVGICKECKAKNNENN